MSPANLNPDSSASAALEPPFKCNRCGYTLPRLGDKLLRPESKFHLQAVLDLACPQCYPNGHWKLKRTAVHKPQADPTNLNVYKHTEQSFEYRCQICTTQLWYTRYQRTKEDCGNITKDPDPPRHHCPACFPQHMWKLDNEDELRKFGPRIERFNPDDPLPEPFSGWKICEPMPYGNKEPVWWYLVPWPLGRISDGQVLQIESFPFVSRSGPPGPDPETRDIWKTYNPWIAQSTYPPDCELPESPRGTRRDPLDSVSMQNPSPDALTVLPNGEIEGDDVSSGEISPTRRDWQTYNNWVEGRHSE
ncbi:hypothetical protein ACEPPN_007121 [Leptodophora sp. 'Broadleaf-Isolate-01']